MQAVKDYYPRYSARGIVRSLFTVNVPYMLPVGLFEHGKFYHVLGDNAPIVMFKPREWRSSSSNTSKPNLFTPLFAKEINECPPGSVTTIYTTTDGGSRMQILYDLVALLEDHVEVVDHEAIADFALRHHHSSRQQPGSSTQKAPQSNSRLQANNTRMYVRAHHVMVFCSATKLCGEEIGVPLSLAKGNH